MQLLQQFDANQWDPTQGAGALPVGKHPVVVETSEVKANKNNDGGYLQLNLKIIDGPQTGVTGAYRLNLYHSNQQTVEIAHRQLSAICHVTGVFNVQDSSQLHGIPFVVEVTPQKNDPKYTEVSKVYDINGNEPGKQNQGANHAAPQQQQQPQQGGQAGGNWGGGQPNQQPNQAPQQQANQGAQWAQGNGGGGQPAQGGQQWGNQAQPQQGGAPAQQGGNGGGWQQNGGGNGGGAPQGQGPNAPWGQRQ